MKSRLLLPLILLCLTEQTIKAQSMIIHMKDGTEQKVYTDKIDYIDFSEESAPDERLTGKWHLGWWCAGNVAIHFDGIEYMFFEGDHLEWGGRQDGQDSYTLSYSNDFTTFTATSPTTSMVEVFTILEKTDQRIALENGGAIRYFYPSQSEALNADNPQAQPDEHLKPEPSHQPTTDLGTILSYSYGYTHSDITPMGQHFENARQATEEDLQWLADPTQDPIPIAGLPGWSDMPVTLYPFGTPQPADVNQHAIGDCSLCSVMTSLAYIYPEFIQNIIHDNGDGTYTIDLYDPQGHPVSVGIHSSFLIDWSGTIGQVSGKNNTPTWATVLEKAVIKWEQIYQVDNVEGIGSEFAAPLFTGSGDSFAFAPNSLHSSELQQAVLWSLDNGRITIGGFDEGDLPCGELYTVVAHAFAFMYPRNATDLFVMRNPWGITSADGLLDIPDERRITQAIDIRTIDPGAAAPYKRQDLGPYQIPSFTARPTDTSVSERVRTNRYLLELPAKVRNRILNIPQP